MSRKLRLAFEGAIYHVTLRGVERRRLFDDDRDRERLLKRLGEAVDELGVRLYLYCLMSNHVHLLVETPKGNLSAFMHKIQTAYTVYYNRRHNRAGHLVQGRFGAKLVEGGAYLLTLSRYIHLNPVFVAKVKACSSEERRDALRAYVWSSYRGYAGFAGAASFVVEGPILAMVEADERKRRTAYRRYVEAAIADPDKEFLSVLKGARWGVGDDEFQSGVRERHLQTAARARRPEDVAFRRAEACVRPEEVTDAVAAEFDVAADRIRSRGYAFPARAVAARLGDDNYTYPLTTTTLTH